MKKNWFYLFALICSVALFTACSDDEDTSWMEYQDPTEYTESMQTVTVDGNVQSNAIVTFAATSANTGTVTFDNLLGESNLLIDVNLLKTDTGYDFSGAKDLKEGYTVNVAGSVTSETITVTVTTTGYATIDGSYYMSSGNLSLTLNGVAVDAASSTASVSVATVSDSQVTISLSGVLPAVYDAEQSGLYFTMENLTLAQEEGTEVYNISGTATYGAATYTVSGSVSADNVLSLSVDTNIDSPVVGEWAVRMGDQGAVVIAEVNTPGQSITLPDSIYNYVPAEMRPLLSQTMTDAQIMNVAQRFLGQYVPYLKSLNFKATGDIDIVYVDMANPTVEQTLSGLLSYVVLDDQILLAPNINALLGMFMSTSNTKAIDFDPSGLLVGAPIPLFFEGDGSSLSFWVDETVVGPLASFVDGLMPLISMMLPSMGVDVDPVVLKMVGDIITYVNVTLAEQNIGLKLGLQMVNN